MVIAKKIPAAAALLTGVMLLGGCDMLEQKAWTPQEPAAVSISEDGGITETIQEELDAAYYDSTELLNMINSEVNNYNAQNGEDSIVIERAETVASDDGQEQTNICLKYASAEDYAQFNNTEFYYGTVINAQLSGYLFDTSYKKVSGGVVQGGEVSGSEVIKRMDKQVLIVRGPMEVHVPGEVLYTSTNSEVLAEDVVNATGESDEEDEGLVLPSSAVYRADDGASFAEAEAAKRVYIVFDM